MLLNLIVFGAFLWLLARLAGWRPALPRLVIDTLSWRNRRSDADDSDSESDSPPDRGPREVAGGTLIVSGQGNRTAIEDAPPAGLVERVTSWLERWADGVPEVVHETPNPGPTDREVERAALVEHLQRERARPGLSAVAIVRAAAGQDGVPWGRVSESTVWRVWREMSDG